MAFGSLFRADSAYSFWAKNNKQKMKMKLLIPFWLSFKDHQALKTSKSRKKKKIVGKKKREVFAISWLIGGCFLESYQNVWEQISLAITFYNETCQIYKNVWLYQSNRTIEFWSLKLNHHLSKEGKKKEKRHGNVEVSSNTSTYHLLLGCREKGKKLKSQKKI